LDWTTGTSAWNDVARSGYTWLGGGESIDTDWLNVRAKSEGSVVGISSGSTRSVIDARPTGTSGSVARSRSASCFARASRSAPTRPRRRLHRERCVEDEERLRVGALAYEPLPDDDRLRRSDRDE